MRKKLIIFSLVLFIVLLPLSSCGSGKIATVNEVLAQATPGMPAKDLKSKCDSAFLEGSFSAFLAKSVDLDTMQIEITTRPSEATLEVWTFKGSNDVAVVQLDRAFGTQTIVDARRASISSVLKWQVEKWSKIGD